MNQHRDITDRIEAMIDAFFAADFPDIVKDHMAWVMRCHLARTNRIAAEFFCVGIDSEVSFARQGRDHPICSPPPGAIICKEPLHILLRISKCLQERGEESLDFYETLPSDALEKEFRKNLRLFEDGILRPGALPVRLQYKGGELKWPKRAR